MSVKLTKAQADLVDWALGAMDDLADIADYSIEEGWYEAADLPVLTGRSLDINQYGDSEASDNAIEDLLYRIEVQMPDVGAHEGPSNLGWWCDKVGGIIRAAAGVDPDMAITI